MTRPLVDFARRLQPDADATTADAVVETAATNRRAEFESALYRLFANLTGASAPSVRRWSARAVYQLSEIVPGALVTYGTELIPALDDDPARPYIAGSLTHIVYEGMRGETFRSDREALVQDLARQIGTDTTVSAVRYLSRIATRWDRIVATVEPTLVDGLSSEDEAVRTAAVRAFATMWAHHLDGTDAIPPLLDCTCDSSPLVRAHAIAALGDIAFQDRGEEDTPVAATPEIIDAGTRLLTDDDERARYDAAACFAEADYWVEYEGDRCWIETVDRNRIDAAVDALVEALDDPSTPVVRQAAVALHIYAGFETRALIPHVDRLVDYGWSVQPNSTLIQRALKSLAADHLSALSDHSSFFLDRLRNHKDATAATILGRLAPADGEAAHSAVSSLTDLLGSPKHTDRRTAAKALAEVHRVDSTLVPDYVEALTEAVDGTDVNTKPGMGWEPLATLAPDHPETATALACQAVDRLTEWPSPPDLRLVYKLGEANPHTISPVADRLIDLLDHDNTSVVGAAAKSLRGALMLDGSVQIPPSAAAALASRLDDLSRSARMDAERIIDVVREESTDA
ncbi:HEAT repeat protein [Salinibacter ruber]|uniref:HEAT repeat protein n=1 Tax=Salinibacter ruber TaxID=146919 RepID=A0A9X2V4S3_9BACT|nr:HEAT repeat domain-containing protein [Salinibacter ruber]MCS3663560.1 HEAT repeat protein [Salinibacter ruber]MCS3701649.1 HEAT repeat protein [Salinibacter ruber]MCS4121335.1 HEAT repeat protein [Salinibacter ruber]